MQEFVKQPNWYLGDKKYEVIEVIYDWKVNFSRGNALKYIARAGIKNPSKETEDLEKAIYYLQIDIGKLREAQALSLGNWTAIDSTVPRRYKVVDVISDWNLNFNRGKVVERIAMAGIITMNDEAFDLDEAVASLQHEIQRIKELRSRELPVGAIKTVLTT